MKKITIKSIQMSAYCLCGASITARGIDPTRAIAEWRKGHTGEGHGPVDRRGAQKARRKAKEKPRPPVETPKEQMNLFQAEEESR